MIDEFFQRNAGKAARAVSNIAKNAVTGTGSAALSASKSAFDWFHDFRWIEFTTAITAAFAAGIALCGSLKIPDPAAHTIAYFGAAVGAACYIRSPKTKWETAKEDEDDYIRGGPRP